MNGALNILMYHSISNAPGPTSIPRETFKGQLEMLTECGYRAISLAEFKAWHSGQTELPHRSVVITFDDGFADFADSAFPLLKAHRCTATVFLPSGTIGGIENWQGADAVPRQLMSWSQIEDLARENIDFGGHSVTHADLTKLDSTRLELEIRQCRDDIAQRLGRTPLSFAPPYGRAQNRERQEIRKWFGISLGTKLERARPGDDLYDVPRIEMHYFRDIRRWRNFLEGRAEWYFTGRRGLRGLKRFATGD